MKVKNPQNNYTEEELLSEYHEKIFDCINSDFTLLILHILLEGYDDNFDGLWIFTLDQFIKTDYFKIQEIGEEARDTNDFYSIEDMVFNKLIWIIEDLDIAKIKRIGMNNISALPELLLKKAFVEGKPTDEETEYYASIIDKICELKIKHNKKMEVEIKNDNDWKENYNKIDFNTSLEASNQIGFTFDIAPSYIELEVNFDEKIAELIKQSIDDYLLNFSQDYFFEKKPIYKEKRYYFSKQLENFYNYIKGLIEINGSVNIPFSSLEEQGFEIVKILSCLEREKILKVNNWNDTDMWNVKFIKQPITLESLIPNQRGDKPTISKDDNNKHQKEKNKIKKITIIKMDNGKLLIAVNENYSETKEIKGYSEMWKIFVKEIEDRNIKPETRTDVKEISKAMTDYFNYNSTKCPIYMGGKYALTEIFTGKGDDTMISTEVKTEIITEAKLLLRKKRKDKK